MVNGSLLTAENGLISIDPELRKQICLVGDDQKAILYVSKGITAAKLMTFQSRIQKQGIQAKVEKVDPEEITKLYKKLNGGQEKTQTQLSVKELFELAAKKRSSDVHLWATVNRGTIVQFRVDRKLRVQPELTQTFEEGMSLIHSITNSMASGANKEIFQQTGFYNARINDPAHLPDSIAMIRVNITPTDDGDIGSKAVFRLQKKVSSIGTWESSGFDENQIYALKYLQKLPTGITIFTGPTGSGKTTSIAVDLDSRLRESDYTKMCYTLEDPPEIMVEGVVPIKVPPADNEADRKKNFNMAIANMLRQDPDIVMLGEIRDAATANVAFEAAMTGHYVLATLHTNNALSSIYRLRELGVPRYLLHDPKILNGIVSQRLVPKLCPHCKKKLMENRDAVKPSEFKRYERATNELDNVYIKGDGCDQCNHTGHLGLTAIAEVLITDNVLMKHISNDDLSGAMEYLRNSEKAYMSLIGSAISKMNQGIVDPRDAEAEVGPLTLDIIEQDGHIHMREMKEVVKDD
ncbi:GspE/PulE family protein [Thiomicrospira sp.]|uniref:GspE/PulE family protein n=1 Tax=Thiomicrospira sp. TaxID=935 RepID=UPI002F93D792